MTPQAFIARWRNNPLTERAGAQGYFDDLCELLGVDKPSDPDNYCFERGAEKTGGGDGWADVWKRGHFGWESKKPGRDLKAALKQLTDYALALENPPLLIVSDRERIEIHTAFTGYPDEPQTLRIEELADESVRAKLRWIFTDPLKLRPEKSTAAITAVVAGTFAQLAQTLRDRQIDEQRVAHFLVQCLFCMFAEDEHLLPERLFTRLLEQWRHEPPKAADSISRLFKAMQRKGGVYGNDYIEWFNGGLFKTIDVPALEAADFDKLLEAARMDWRAIDPTIFGTLFERGLNPKARAPLGAHYTDTGTIDKLIRPLVFEPLSREWEEVREKLTKAMRKAGKKIPKAALDLYQTFLLRLENFRVLDPACGSGNFLYLSLRALREVEKRARVEAAEMGLQADLAMHTGPHNILGLEINEFAAELARVTVWIGDIQWSRQNGYPPAVNPILRPLDGIEHRDALLNVDGSEAEWPEADVIVGNPPFIGDRKMIRALGEDYTATLRTTYEGRVPGGADFVTYWFEKARAQITDEKTKTAGFVATNSVRGGSNRKVLDRVCKNARIFEAWNDEPWINDGAAVRVSLIGFGKHPQRVRLNGEEVATIAADLSAHDDLNVTDLTKAVKLAENANVSFIGTQKNGPFDVPGKIAREWLKLPNPEDRNNAEVVRPWCNALDITRRPQDRWVIDFGNNMPQEEASLYEIPFSQVITEVKPTRLEVRRDWHRKHWWLFGDPRPALRRELAKLKRFIVTPMVAKHRLFAWLPAVQIPENLCVVIVRDDDTTFGILHSRFHELWSLRMCTWMGVGNDPRYTPSTCFETFPFPAGFTPRDTAQAEAIAAAAIKLNELRNDWLNPPKWVDWVITPEEEEAHFPARPVAKPGHAADLKQRTLTNLYNARPAWLAMAHQALDQAVAAAYGWQDYTPEMPDDEILRRLLALNLARS